MIDGKIYVITHRQYPIQQDELYRTLTVGRCRIENALSEQDGECITQYNDRINELTGLYWMWKNTDSKYIGLSHYRRYFYDEKKGKRLDGDAIEEILCENDIILTIPVELHWKIYDKPVYENISERVGERLAHEAHMVFRDLLKERQPDYVDAFDYVLHENRMYVCNMFVTRREIMNRYCEWLFSFITDAADRINVKDLPYIQKRVAGYFGEVMPTVWMEKQDLRVHQMPIMVKWDNNKDWTIQRESV